jgi:hypothetical protein
VDLSNSSLEVSVYQKFNISYKIPFKIIEKDYLNKIAKLDLNYPNV